MEASPNEPPKAPVEADDYYNHVFEKLSNAPSPIAGALAYALYKIAKREWIQQFIKDNKRRPTEAEYRHHTATQTEAVLGAYLSRANQILAEYADNVIKDVRPNILKDALKGSFSRLFWPSFWASLAFAGVLLLIVAIAALFGFGLPIQIAIPAKPGISN